MIHIYTDGSSIPSTGQGGYAALVKSETTLWVKGRSLKTTNNRMEIMAVLRGLEKTPVGSDVTVHSDAKYVVNPFKLGWIKNWEKKKWFRNGEQIPNADLWTILKDLVEERRVAFIWVKGHNGHIENEACDKAAREALRSSPRDLLGEKPKLKKEKPKKDLFNLQKPLAECCPTCHRPFDGK